jgi:hypothetical protein
VKIHYSLMKINRERSYEVYDLFENIKEFINLYFRFRLLSKKKIYQIKFVYFVFFHLPSLVNFDIQRSRTV